MATARLDGPFAATRRYGLSPLPLFFDILTLPLQISNTLTGIPPLEIPVFDGAASAPAPAPTAPPAGGGLEGSFGVVGLSPMPSGLGLQSISVGAATFSAVRVTWSGQIRNSGNTPLSGATARLQTLFSPSGPVIREAAVALPALAPGAAASVSLPIDILSSDPPGSFMGRLLIEQAGGILGQLSSLVLGTINPTSGISIEGTFGI